jgi:hypothetical protein
MCQGCHDYTFLQNSVRTVFTNPACLAKSFLTNETELCFPDVTASFHLLFEQSPSYVASLRDFKFHTSHDYSLRKGITLSTVFLSIHDSLVLVVFCPVSWRAARSVLTQSTHYSLRLRLPPKLMISLGAYILSCRSFTSRQYWVMPPDMFDSGLTTIHV